MHRIRSFVSRRRRLSGTIVFLVLVAAGGATYVSHRQPTPTPTPTPVATATPIAGADVCLDRCVLNPDVTQATISTTICRSGWTATIRPPASYTSALKQSQMAALNIPGSPSDYEEDHRLALELGGNPTAPHNLTPEAHPGSSAKDSAENAAKTAVCSGTISLVAEQAQFIATWLGPWPAYLK